MIEKWMWEEEKEFNEWYDKYGFKPGNEDYPDGDWYIVIKYWAFVAWRERARRIQKDRQA